MAQLDPNIALQVRGPQFQSPFELRAQMEQIQASQNENRLAQMKMREYQDGADKKNRLRDLMRGSVTETPTYGDYQPDNAFGEDLGNLKTQTGTNRLFDQGKFRNSLYGEGFIDEAQAFDANQTKQDKDKAGIAKDNAAAEKTQIEGHLKKFELAGQIMSGVKDQATWEVARQQTAQVFGPEAAAQMPGQYDPAVIEQKRQQAMTIKDQLEQKWKAMEFTTPTANARLSADTSTANNTANNARIQSEGVENREAARVKATTTNPVKPLTELQTNKLRTDMGKDYSTATSMLSQMEDVLDSAKAVKGSKGLEAATGYSSKFPSWPGGEASFADTRIANLRAKVTAMGKAAAALSGSIGPMAVQEWKIVADQIAVMEEVKGKGPLLEQINLIEAQAEGAIERIRDKYENTRGEDFDRFPQFRNLPGPRSRGGAKTPPGKTITRTGMSNGKKVIQYSDGSVEYAK